MTIACITLFIPVDMILPAALLFLYFMDSHSINLDEFMELHSMYLTYRIN